MKEIRKIAAVYQNLHARGFEVLGVSLDKVDAQQKVEMAIAENKMPWAQVFDGAAWGSLPVQLYGIESIPAPFLIDGDTGNADTDFGECSRFSRSGTIRQEIIRERDRAEIETAIFCPKSNRGSGPARSHQILKTSVFCAGHKFMPTPTQNYGDLWSIGWVAVGPTRRRIGWPT
jgi:hypothetical protein